VHNTHKKKHICTSHVYTTPQKNVTRRAVCPLLNPGPVLKFLFITLSSFTLSLYSNYHRHN
jgi:hypothetical protein